MVQLSRIALQVVIGIVSLCNCEPNDFDKSISFEIPRQAGIAYYEIETETTLQQQSPASSLLGARRLSSTLDEATYGVESFTDNTTYCIPFSTSNTFDANINSATCSFGVCNGSTLTVSIFNCTGGPLLYLANADDVAVAWSTFTCTTNKDAFTSVISHTISSISSIASSCGFYSLRQGCVKASSCSGSAVITGTAALFPTPSPTALPTVAPTPKPTVSSIPTLPPTAHPTSSPTLIPYYCDPYKTTNTANLTRNAVPCHFMLCGGETTSIRISNCTSGKPAAILAKGYYTGQITGSTTLVSSGKTAQCPAYKASNTLISYTASGVSASCQAYTLFQGCFNVGSCAATFDITNAFPVPTASPTTAPTRTPTAPTASPTASPTTLPTTSPPTAVPTAKPTSGPTLSPTMYPTVSSVACSTYSTTGTVTASSPACYFYACKGETISLSVTCGSSSSTPFATVKSPTGVTFASNGAVCPGTSSSTKVVGPTVTTEGCGTYTILQACSTSGCSISNVYWTVYGAQYTPSPTKSPTSGG